MSVKTKQYEKKIKKLEKFGKYGISGESGKNGTREVDTPPRKLKHPRLRRLRSSRYPNNLCLAPNKSERASFGTPWGEETKKQALMTALRHETDKRRNQRAQKAHQGRQSRSRKLTAPNRAVGQRKVKDSYGFLPDERRSEKQMSCSS